MNAKTLQKYRNKTKTQLKNRAKHYFHKYIRLRDTDDFGYGTCISSGRMLRYGTESAQAGHFYSAGHYPALEFDEDNVHLQSKADNYFKSGNLIEYRKVLSAKIGEERLKRLDLKAEQNKHKAFRVTREYYIDLIETYKKKVKELSKEKMFEVK